MESLTKEKIKSSNVILNLPDGKAGSVQDPESEKRSRNKFGIKPKKKDNKEQRKRNSKISFYCADFVCIALHLDWN